MLRKLINKINETNYARKMYFAEAEEEITELNLSLIRTLSGVLTVLILFFMAITPFIVVNWRPTLQHLLFAPSIALFIAISYLYDWKGKKTKNTVDFLCLLFCAVITMFVISIDVFPSRNAPSSFMPIVLIVLPVLFVIPFRKVYLLMLIFEIVYIITLFYYKSEAMLENDLFNSIVGIIISFVEAWIMMKLRVDSYNAKNKYRYLSTIDALTGVLNKTSCEREINGYLNTQNIDSRCSLIIIDIDNFKTVNDRLGHQMGDEVLKSVGRMLVHSFDATDIIGRIGGDEFVVLMDSVCDKDILKKKCKLLYSKTKAVSESINFDISFSIGISIQEDSGISFKEMFKSADDALYETKAFCKGHYIIHTVSKEINDSGRRVILISANNLIEQSDFAEKFSYCYDIKQACGCEDTLNELSKYNEYIDLVVIDMTSDKDNAIKLLKYMKFRENLSGISIVAVGPNDLAERFAAEIGIADVVYSSNDKEKICESIYNVISNKNNKTVEL